MTIPGCMKKWKNLRDHFVREIRKRRTKPSGGQGPPYESRWPHFEAMTFICDSVLHRGLVNRIKMLCTLYLLLYALITEHIRILVRAVPAKPLTSYRMGMMPSLCWRPPRSKMTS